MWAQPCARFSHGGARLSMLDVRDGVIPHIPQQRDRRASWPAARLRGEGTEARRAWRATYVRRLFAVDAVVALAAGAAGQDADVGPVSLSVSSTSSPVWAMFVLPVLWVGAMLAARAYEQRF